MRSSDVVASAQARTFDSEGVRIEVLQRSEQGHSCDLVVLKKRHGHWASATNLLFWIVRWWLCSLYQMKKTQEERP